MPAPCIATSREHGVQAKRTRSSRKGGTIRPELEVADREDLFDRAASIFVAATERAIRTRGRAAVALSGGATPGPMFGRLASADLAWDAVDVFQVDERVAPPRHPDRNLTLIERELSTTARGKPRIHPMPVEAENLDRAADEYAADLVEVCGRPPVLDAVQLGLGADGHTASLVPADPVLEVRDRLVAVTGLYEGRRRMTLTYPVLDLARFTLLLVAGEDRAPAVRRLLEGDEGLPAVRVAADPVVLLADAPAAAGVSD